MSANTKLEKCFKEGNQGKERHKGLREIDYNQDLIDQHIQKAIHNLQAIRTFRDVGYSDWSASAAFYAVYHCLLALILKFGYESRNQSCTFALIEDLITQGKINLPKEDLKEVFDNSITDNLAHSEKILDVRERMQYSARTSLNDEEFIRLFEKTKTLFDKIRQEIEK